MLYNGIPMVFKNYYHLNCNMLKTLFSFALCSMLASSAWALQLPEIFSDNMMLQQQTKAKMWGWAKAGNVVEVTTTWSDLKHSATAGADGRWMVEISTPSASYDTYSMTVKGDGETVVINNVLVGEVWFCSGQSNMEMPLGGFWNCPVEGANEAIGRAYAWQQYLRWRLRHLRIGWRENGRRAIRRMRRLSLHADSSSPARSPTCSMCLLASSTAHGAEAAWRDGCQKRYLRHTPTA